MSASTANADYFGTFLGSMQRERSADTPAHVMGATVQKSLLGVLLHQEQPMKISQIIQTIDEPPTFVLQALGELEKAKLLTIDNNQAVMTALGRSLVS